MSAYGCPNPKQCMQPGAQERAALLAEVAGVREGLAAAQEACRAAEARASEAQARVVQLEGELNDAKRQVSRDRTVSSTLAGLLFDSTT